MLRQLIARAAAVAALAAALLLPAGPAAAQDGPAGGYISFEGGSDGAVIGSSIPGLSFSNTAGMPWRYGDARSGAYNAPFPQDCPSFGGQCAYAVSGNLFAWMGPVQGTGRIDFTGGGATYLTAAFSTAEPLTIEAYDEGGRLVDSESLAPNARTGRLAEVTVAAPAIGYVLIRGAENRWLLDDLRTDATGVPFDEAPIGEGGRRYPALVTVEQEVGAPAALAPGAVYTLTVVATNRGRGLALDTTITLPLDPARVRVVDAALSRKEAWVSRAEPERLELRTGPMSKDTVVTATLRLQVLAEAPAGAELGGRLSFSWKDKVRGGRGSSNLLALAVGGGATGAPAPLVALAGAPRGLAANVFLPGEPVALWRHDPDGAVVAMGRVTAGADGSIQARLEEGQAPGAYTLVAQGVWSEIVATGALAIP